MNIGAVVTQAQHQPLQVPQISVHDVSKWGGSNPHDETGDNNHNIAAINVNATGSFNPPHQEEISKFITYYQQQQQEQQQHNDATNKTINDITNLLTAYNHHSQTTPHNINHDVGMNASLANVANGTEG
eukprot:1057782-Ditylum_brightwellii.AAC.1